MSKIIELSFEDNNRNISIADLFESIEFCRGKGRNLSAIYGALKMEKYGHRVRVPLHISMALLHE